MAGVVEEEGKVEMQNSINLDRLRDLIKSYIEKHHYESALFWADKVVSLSNGELADVFTYAQTLYLTHQYHRAAHLLTSRKLEKSHLSCRYLAAQCHYQCKEYQDALELLDLSESGNTSKSSGRRRESKLASQMEQLGPLKNVKSSIHLLRGKVYEAMDNRSLAVECFQDALQQDVYNYEAFDHLVNHHMLTAQEERDLIESLPFSKQCPEEEIELTRFLYENRLKKYNKPSTLSIPNSLEQLSDNLDIVVNLAERHYYNCNFQECLKITSVVLAKDPYNSQCLPLHIAVLVELKQSNNLFYLAHKLVDLYPNQAVAWFAVGCYYYLVGKHELARRYFSKATSLDRIYGPAWLAFGHSFAAEKEHDQAMAAYFTAAQLMKGCHLPVLYIGLEYCLTNNPKLAERFSLQALSIAPEDPFALHAMGVIAFQSQDWTTAERYFKEALNKIQEVSEDGRLEKWEPLLNNLGHVSRKLKKYDDALQYHRQALILSPQDPSTLSAIGYVHSLTGQYMEAVDYFHKALGLRRHDAFSTTMLGNVVEQLMSQMSPCDGAPDDLPPFEYTGKLDVSSACEEEGVLSESTDYGVDGVVEASSLLDSSSMAIEEVDMEDND